MKGFYVIDCEAANCMIVNRWWIKDDKLWFIVGIYIIMIRFFFDIPIVDFINDQILN